MPRPLQAALVAGTVIAAAYLAARPTTWRGADFLKAEGKLVDGSDDNGVHYAAVRVTQPAPPHGFFEKPLPSATGEMWANFEPPHHPPRRWVQRRLCGADPTVLARVQAAIGTDPAKADMYGPLLDECRGMALCDLASQWLDGGSGPRPVTAFLSRVLASCSPESLRGLLEDPDISLVARARWFVIHPDPNHVDDAVLLALLRAVRDDAPDRTEVFEYARAVQRSPGDREARRQLEALRDGGSHVIAFALEDLDRFSDARRLEAAGHDLDGALLDGGIWPQVLVSPDGGLEQRFREALINCARARGRPSTACLSTLAVVDWSLARSVAQSMPPGDFGDRRSLLTLFDSPVNLARAFGLDAGAESASTLMFFGLDNPDRSFPASFLGDPRMLDDFQRLASELDEAVFVVARAKTAADSTTVTAWHADRRYDLRIAAGCNVEDPKAMIGLLNVLLRDARATRRYYAVELLGSPRASVMVLEPGELQRLVAGDLVRVLDPAVAQARKPRDDDF